MKTSPYLGGVNSSPPYAATDSASAYILGTNPSKSYAVTALFWEA